ncbi:Fic family protein [Alterisphingorhabdus coralli]|uniref:Fic family protein n=1 Tax=Alterisphingorhabdus coralli TaxID=3071408 RepID=A0AA97I1E8_9SPHN|nr:Fic family protein [Parasphingorhabdus sp. SCSIO 66989]WOE74660.1 Fic family protein [Parasphingorhabdus sp. SCSIO 66989]
MQWNWQQPDWPNFDYDAAALQAAEERFLKGAGVVVGAMLHADGEEKDALTIELIAQETVDSSAIEGEVLDRASVQSSLARHMGIRAEHRRANAAETGAAELMANLYQTYDDPISDQLLFDWHSMLMAGRRDLNDIGRYRTQSDPMQIVSGALHAPRVHYEAPPSDAVPQEMHGFIAWLNQTAPTGAKPLPAITRAGIAHLWFESIHPFEDGNGRIGRAIAEKALAQTIEAPTLTALAETIHRHRKDYYAQLQRASQSNQLDDWLSWFADIVLAAQERTLTRIRFLIEKTRLLDRLRGQINERQEKALIRMFAEGPDGFAGGLSAKNYRTITDATTATATRDLADLVRLGALRREGERKSTRYYLAIGE